MQACRILAGKHKSDSSRIKLHWAKKELGATFRFEPSCEYQINVVDQKDINKLFGLSYGFHHKNSIRFGWRFSLAKNKIEIFGYSYMDAKRLSIFICDCEIGKDYDFQITTTSDSYELSCLDIEAGEYYTNQMPHQKLRNWGYHLYPYFGGNIKAPHDIWMSHSKI